MKKWLKITLLAILALFLIPIIALVILHQPRPELVPSAEADQLAEKMLEAVNKPAWDTTRWVQWTYANRNSYVWDRERNLVQVEWGEDNMALINPDKRTGFAFTAGQQLAGEEQSDMVKKALGYFFNDSFWLLAPTKVFDPGTQRGLVDLKNEEGQGLLVSYSSGGVTPGDAYLWILDNNGLPRAYRMWVNILPIGGLKASWEEWQTMPSGAKYAASHKILNSLDGRIGDLKSGQNLEEINLQTDPFNSFF